mmetsp:Transcript_2663/g.3992  ORF Transcript_2663/g.3992 Transcript_2663/m.3992 type:complete len:665 (-) Transcript_2663:132-2126(-)
MSTALHVFALAAIGVVCLVHGESDASLDAVDQCTVDNWGQPHQTRRPFRSTYTTAIREKCAAEFAKSTPMATTLQNAMVNFYPNTSIYDTFKGIDLVPENNHLFADFPSPWKRNLDASKSKPGSMHGMTCDTPMDDGSTWSVTRIGPMITRGGYDWTQIGWDDVFGLEEKLKRFPDGVYALEQVSVPVLKDGTRLGNPPVHIHHIHVGPKTGVRQRTDLFACLTSSDGEVCYDPTRVFEHHGDYQCTEDEGGLDCLVETIPDGYGKLLTYPLGLEGDINDVRAVDSEPLEWYYELGIRWVPRIAADGTESTIKPINFFNFAGPGDFSLRHQNSYIFTFQAPTDHDNLFWYTGRMPFSGQMLRNKFHAHNKIFKESIFFAASPAELGLTRENKLVPDKPYHTVDIRDGGFNSLDEVKQFIMDNLDASAKAFDTLHGEGYYTSVVDMDNDKSSRLRPRAVCHGVSKLEEVEGYFYDRREPTCCAPWDIERGDIFTVVGFNKKLQHAMGPHTDIKPATFPGHVGWWLSTTNEEEKPISRFGLGMFTQEPNGYLYDIKRMSPYQRLGYQLNGGTISHHNVFFHDQFLGSAILLTLLSHPIVFLILILMLVGILIHRCLKNYVIRVLKKRSPNSSSDDSCPDPEAVIHSVAKAVTNGSEAELINILHKQ